VAAVVAVAAAVVAAALRLLLRGTNSSDIFNHTGTASAVPFCFQRRLRERGVEYISARILFSFLEKNGLDAILIPEQRVLLSTWSLQRLAPAA
jgi:hypothetical protein